MKIDSAVETSVTTTGSGPRNLTDLADGGRPNIGYASPEDTAAELLRRALRCRELEVVVEELKAERDCWREIVEELEGKLSNK